MQFNATYTLFTQLRNRYTIVRNRYATDTHWHIQFCAHSHTHNLTIACMRVCATQSDIIYIYICIYAYATDTCANDGVAPPQNVLWDPHFSGLDSWCVKLWDIQNCEIHTFCEIHKIVRHTKLYDTHNCMIHTIASYTKLWDTQNCEIHKIVRHTKLYDTHSCMIHTIARYTKLWDTQNCEIHKIVW